MTNKKLIRTITEADIPLELVDKEVFAQLKARDHTYVHARQLKSSRDLLISEDFSKCQGVCFLDDRNEVGALAHNYSTHDPYDTLTGECTGGEYHLEDPREIFDNLGRVLAVHVYHEHCYEWPQNWIKGALARIGIKKLVHIPIKSKHKGIFSRHIVHDVRNGSVYVFPTDFDAGFRFHPNGMR